MKRIKKHIIAFICLMIMLAMPKLSVKAEEVTSKTAVQVPESPVTISDFKMNTHSAKPGDKVQYSFTINDVSIKEFLNKYGEMYECFPEYYGVNSVTLYWVSTGKQSIVHTYKWENNKGWNTESLKVSGKISVQKGMQTGEWHLAKMFFDVGADEEGFIITDDRHSVNDKYPESPDPLMDLSMADFTVSGTGKVDYKAPTIDLKSLKVSRRYVKRNQKSTFSVKVKDQSTIKEVECRWCLYEKGNYGKKWDYVKSYKMKYNKKNKKYECTIKLDTKYYRKAQLSVFVVKDIYGNERTYSTNYTDPKIGRRYYNAFKKMLIIKK